MTTLFDLLRLDGVSVTVFAMMAVVGAVIFAYARTYLQGDPGRPRFLRWFVATLGSVSLLVLSNHVLLLIGARLASSLCLHRLLTFYDRPRARLAAHKKFLASRTADVCLLVAAGLIWARHDTLFIDELFAAHAAGGAVLSVGLQVAMALIAVAALLQCAQMPTHGWLMQVMEAPTPVSALLHAGVVNVGGFILIRFAPLLVDAQVARGLVLVVGGLTAAIASLVMLTRVSVKVELAWSTCAQMGFMLVECGLGLWPLALLHLVAHSFYKAHAFLGSGGAVAAAVARRRAPVAAPPTGDQWSVASGFVAAGLLVALVYVDGLATPQGLAVAAVLAGAVLVLLAEAFAARTPSSVTRIGLFAAVLVGAHVALGGAFGGLAEPFAPAVDASWWATGFVAALSAGLVLVHAVLRSDPAGTLARRLYPALYGGLFLDEWFTRFTLRVWPARWSRPVRPVLGPSPSPSPSTYRPEEPVSA